MNKTVIIQASARSHGDTRQYVDYLLSKGSMDLEDLNTYQIAQYHYEHQYTDDDFLTLAERLIEGYDTWVFATPLYWYSMSGHLKTFLDRISDLLRIRKEQARQLGDMKLATLAVSIADDLPAYYFEPFQKSADYLKMNYLASCHTYGDPYNINEEMKTRLDLFHDKILAV